MIVQKINVLFVLCLSVLVVSDGYARDTRSTLRHYSKAPVKNKSLVNANVPSVSTTDVKINTEIKKEDAKKEFVDIDKIVQDKSLENTTAKLSQDSKMQCLKTDGVWGKIGFSGSRTRPVEDGQNIENNECYKKVDLRSDDKKLNLTFEPVYYSVNQNVQCGAWESEENITKMIQDSKKGVRIGSSIAASLGGFGVGFGGTEAIVSATAKEGGKLYGQTTTLSVDEQNELKQLMTELNNYSSRVNNLTDETEKATLNKKISDIKSEIIKVYPDLKN